MLFVEYKLPATEPDKDYHVAIVREMEQSYKVVVYTDDLNEKSLEASGAVCNIIRIFQDSIQLTKGECKDVVGIINTGVTLLEKIDSSLKAGNSWMYDVTCKLMERCEIVMVGDEVFECSTF